MSKPNRPPIDYTPQFKGDIFRPKEVIEEELASADGDATAETPLQQQESSFERTNERANQRTKERTRVRHSFDIWHDQLLSLVEIQTNIFRRKGKKPRLGELVQEALEAYINTHSERTHVRTNERSKERRTSRLPQG